MSLETSLAVGLVSPGSFVKLGLFSFDLYFFHFGCFLSLQICVVNSVLGKHYRQGLECWWYSGPVRQT